MKPKSTKLTEHDAAILETLAAQKGMTVSVLINTVLGLYARQHGHEWDGITKSWGNAARFGKRRG